MYHHENSGLKNVWLVNGFTTRKTLYGKAVAIVDVPGLTCAICLALAGNTEQAVALWEKIGRSPPRHT